MMDGIMEEKTVRSFSKRYNNTVCGIEIYTFSPGITFEFCKVNSLDNGEHRHNGLYQFRLDFTQIGRFECEFLDRTFSYRGENEITLLATPTDENWCLAASFPNGVYHGCALIIYLDKLTEVDRTLLGRFGIYLDKLIDETGVNQRWRKLPSAHLVNLFHDIYHAHETSNLETIFLKSFEMLIYISQNYKEGCIEHIDTDFFPAYQVKNAKGIHAYVTRHYMENISFELLAKKRRINYSIFNKIFKEMYGDTPYQYLKKLRMNAAAQKLLESNMSITDIASMVGYTNPSKFSRAFKTVMGVLPHKFRK
jgi:AraC-like DNA-binding protein